MENVIKPDSSHHCVGSMAELGSSHYHFERMVEPGSSHHRVERMLESGSSHHGSQETQRGRGRKGRASTVRLSKEKAFYLFPPSFKPWRRPVFTQVWCSLQYISGNACMDIYRGVLYPSPPAS